MAIRRLQIGIASRRISCGHFPVGGRCPVLGVAILNGRDLLLTIVQGLGEIKADLKWLTRFAVGLYAAGFATVGAGAAWIIHRLGTHATQAAVSATVPFGG